MVDLFERKDSHQPTQYIICPPNMFIRDRSVELLPAWSQPVESIVLVLQQCPCSLRYQTIETEKVKNKLRQCFLEFGRSIVRVMAELNYLVEVFDPSTGMPTQSSLGQTTLDDVALIHSLLEYPVVNCGGCSVLVHPIWNDAVYPSTIFTSAPLAAATQIVGCQVEMITKQNQPKASVLDGA